MRYIFAFLIPPLAVFMCKRPGQGVFNLLVWLVSIPCIFFLGIGLIGCRMEGLNPDDAKELRTAALKIRDIFLVDGQRAAQHRPKPAASPKPVKPTLVNVPMDFELQSLDPDHPYLKERGFDEETIRHFGLGFCNRGMLKHRVAIPLHDPQGRLVGYAGRITRDDMISETCPKYLFPGTREKDGKLLEFRKSHLLYNAHKLKKPVDHLFVVEGFPATWWLWQAKYRNTVALMGSDCSETQAKLIVDLVSPDGKVWLMPDGDEAAIRCAKSVLSQVSPHRFIRWVPLAGGLQPTDCSEVDLIELFGA